MKGYEKVKEMLESELEDYSYFRYDEIKINNSYTQTEENEYYEVDIKNGNEEEKTLNFHYLRKDDKLEIETSEEIYEEITTYDWRVKYFWMALLKW